MVAGIITTGVNKGRQANEWCTYLEVHVKARLTAGQSPCGETMQQTRAMYSTQIPPPQSIVHSLK